MCNESNVHLHLLRGEFENFSASRNKMLEFARQCVEGKYLLLLDANEEVRNLEELKKLEDVKADLILVKYILEKNKKRVSFYRPSIVSLNKLVEYRMPVHEFIYYDPELSESTVLKNTSFHIYQNRCEDKSSKPRHERDVAILQECLKKEPKDTRSMFYLAQSYMSLGKYSEAFKWYFERLKHHPKCSSDEEEMYRSLTRCCELSLMLSDTRLAFGLINSLLKYERIEGYILASKFYEKQNNLKESLKFMEKACKVEKPNGCEVEFVHDDLYDTYRWELLEKLKKLEE